MNNTPKKVDWRLVFSLSFSPFLGSLLLGIGLSQGDIKAIIGGILADCIAPFCIFVFYPWIDRWEVKRRKKIADEYQRELEEIDRKYHTAS